MTLRRLLLGVALVTGFAASAAADWIPFDRLPNADKVQKARQQWGNPRGATPEEVRWTASTAYMLRDGAWSAIDRSTGKRETIRDKDVPESAVRGGRSAASDGPGVARGRQRTSEPSPDGERVAIHEGGHVFITRGAQRDRITPDAPAGVKFGIASWVYGEELDQKSAMWWHPQSSALAYYSFDESKVPEFLLSTELTKQRPGLDRERYPKPGDPNPIAGLSIYSIVTGRTTQVKVGDADQYVYGVQWTPDGKDLLFHRLNRLQNRLELCLADPATGEVRVVLVEEQRCYQNHLPKLRFLAKEPRSFLWESERTGYAHFERRSLDGGEPVVLTKGEFAMREIHWIDEDAGTLWCIGYSGKVAINPHLWRVALDGSGGNEVTTSDMHWSSFSVAPDGGHVIAVEQSIDSAPRTVLVAKDGSRVAVVAERKGDAIAEKGWPRPELLQLKAADGTTTLYGTLHKPKDWKEGTRLPAVVQVYGGPFFRTVENTYDPVEPLCEFGVLVVKVDNRGTPGRGKAFEDATYLNLGIADLDDQAAAIRQLVDRGLVDRERVGITGFSYGGTMSALALLRYPEDFAVAVAGGAVTDWNNYDSIYTERYLRTPAENPKGYEQSSCVRLAGNLKGSLLIVHGMVDDNVHPANAWQLADALQSKGKPFDMMLFPNSGHGIWSPSYESVTWSHLLRGLGLAN
ncbi:MAG: DPP IV N-terminal domain-containing protein [Bacteroidia bacterium]|nr:DPP IV N-terminal domain-containing protein [Bacteroidia bacterium]